MKTLHCIALAICLATPLFAFGTGAVADGFRMVELKPSDASLSALLAGEVQKARALHLTPYVQFSATWCGPCRRLHAGMSDPLMIDAFEGTYVIQLDSDAWKEKIEEAGFNVKGIPAFFALDAKGKPTEKSINGGAWGEDIPKNMAPPLKKFFAQNAWKQE